MPSKSSQPTTKYTKEEKQLVDLCALLTDLRDIKRQEQAKVQEVTAKKHATKVVNEDTTASSIEKAKKLLEAQKNKPKPLPITPAKRIDRPSSSQNETSSPPQKRPRLPDPHSPSLRQTNEPPPYRPYERDNNRGPGGSTSQVFVGDLNPHLPPDEHRRLMEDCFSRYGNILSLRLLSGKNCGFVIYGSRSEAENAIEGMNRQPLGGSTIRVSWGKERYGDDWRNNRRF